MAVHTGPCLSDGGRVTEYDRENRHSGQTGWRESYHGTTRMLLVGNHARGEGKGSAKNIKYVSYQGYVDIDNRNGQVGSAGGSWNRNRQPNIVSLCLPFSYVSGICGHLWHLIHFIYWPDPVYPRVSMKYHPIPRNSHLAVGLAWIGIFPPPLNCLPMTRICVIVVAGVDSCSYMYIVIFKRMNRYGNYSAGTSNQGPIACLQLLGPQYALPANFFSLLYG